jgi:hypothetical protein
MSEPTRDSTLAEGADRLAAQDRATHVDELHALASHEDFWVRYFVAANPHTDERTKELLCQDPEWLVRGRLAVDPLTPGDLLRALGVDACEGVRVRIAGNIRTPSGVLASLAHEAASQVEESVPFTFLQAISNPSTPGEALGDVSERLSLFCDEAYWDDFDLAIVVRSLLRNPSSPQALRSRVVAYLDEHEGEGWPARADFSLTGRFELHAWVGARDPRTPPEELAGLAALPRMADGEYCADELDLGLLLNPSLPSGTLRRFFSAVGEDDLLAPLINGHLGADPEWGPVEVVGWGWEAVESTWVDWAANPVRGSWADDSVIKRAVERGSYVALRCGWARNPSVPLDVLAALAADPEDLVRAAVAENRRTPVEIIRALALDPSSCVRASVMRNPQADDQARAAAVLQMD